ncbi:MAG: hypothetical protein AB7U75_21625 [Hyphomicrobiaceae bacterium]
MMGRLERGSIWLAEGLVLEDKVREHSARSIFTHADNLPTDLTFGIFMDVDASRAIRQAEVGGSRTTIARNE